MKIDKSTNLSGISPPLSLVILCSKVVVYTPGHSLTKGGKIVQCQAMKRLELSATREIDSLKKSPECRHKATWTFFDNSHTQM